MTDRQKKQPRVLLVTVTGELPRYYEYYNSIDRLILPPYTGKTSCHSSSPAKNRNLVITRALANGTFTHLFFTDDDMVYSPDTVMRLLAHDVDIVSGLYCMKQPPFPLIALNNPDEEDMSAFINAATMKPNELIRVARVPAGCLLVSTNALKRMTPPYYFTLGEVVPDEWADDIKFCDRARAIGIEIYLDTGVRCGHITKCVLTPEWRGNGWSIQHRINSELGIEMES